ncbi:MAG: hypothetical protein EXS49_00050 [Candidatus Pacebacteria bacterium]|nr:hypothetical protein [Candidatus Paceibacterota bacterium]
MCGCAGGYEDDDLVPEHHMAKVRHDCTECKAVIPVDSLYYVGKCKRPFCSVICKERADKLRPEAILFQSGSIQ